MDNGVHGAAAVAGEAWYDVKVQMGDDLAGGSSVVEPNIQRRGPQSASDTPGDHLHRLKDLARQFGGQTLQPLGVHFGDDQRMAICHGVNIQKRQRILIFVDFMSRQFPAHDSAENTVHGLTLLA